MNKKQLVHKMRRLKAAGRHEDVKAAQEVLAQIGRNAKQLKQQADESQLSLFDGDDIKPVLRRPADA